MIKSRNKSGQHYLLSAEARTLSLMQIMRLSDDEAFEMFKAARWEGGEPVCPQCGGIEHYWLKTRKQWRCKHKECNHSFSVTSGTLFANAKMPLRVYLAAIALYSNCAKGMSALQMSRDLDVQYKTAFVLMHKMRESLGEPPQQLEGEVEIDGAYFNGHVRPQNERRNRVDRRLKKNQDPDKRVIMVARQRSEDGTGAAETVVAVAKSENEKSALAFAKKHVHASATITTDEHVSYNTLRGHYKVERVNHQINYVGPAGESTNQAESFFSRLRRMHIGQTHKFGNNYLDRYAREAAYREDTRRKPNGFIFHDVMGRCASKPPSRDFCVYWQGNKKSSESLLSTFLLESGE